jgi:SagB-type dehydrogenase family enzyme
MWTLELVLVMREKAVEMSPLAAALARRRSVREFSGEWVGLDAVGRMLWSGQGVVGEGRRTVPSAGGLYPLTLSLVAGRVADLEPGLYRYEPVLHALEPASGGDLRKVFASAAIGAQPWLAEAAAIVVVSGDLGLAALRFADQPPISRGARYVHLEAGAVVQNISLQAGVDGLGAVLVGGFDDEAVRAHLPAGEEPVALVAVGCPAT